MMWMKSLEYQGEKSVDTENNMQSLGLQNTPAIGVVCTTFCWKLFSGRPSWFEGTPSSAAVLVLLPETVKCLQIKKMVFL